MGDNEKKIEVGPVNVPVNNTFVSDQTYLELVAAKKWFEDGLTTEEEHKEKRRSILFGPQVVSTSAEYFVVGS